MQWTKTDPENLPESMVVFCRCNILYLGFFNQKNKIFVSEDFQDERPLENSYYIKLPPLPEEK
jgi:hypothetical protein